MGTDEYALTKSWVKKFALVNTLLAAGVYMTACSSPITSVVATKATNKVVLKATDAMKTIQVHVPAQITLNLPYGPSSGMVWQLVSGGAGFSMPRSPVFHDPGSGATLGTEEFSFVMKGKGTLPVVLDYMKPGPITGTPHQFKVTLHGT